MEFITLLRFAQKLISRANSGDYHLDRVPNQYRNQMKKLLDEIKYNNYSYNYILGELMMYNDSTLCNHEFFKTCMLVY